MFIIAKPDGGYFSVNWDDSVYDAVHYADREQAERTIHNLAADGVDIIGYRVIDDPLPWAERLAAYDERTLAGF